ncbi:4-hydroxy-2-oxovalerate aldolase (plasmid) [Haloterrigena turkmenica DSM 5511]|uniref:4-hydroxy-2-oxovalerate aldolase n=1 Tax=Haloterrigena turkmenica (strain ATCC 51198 / DSM 5511 / JCM 9101 / NCIMB 13204 / VKM B-1734 / 4k) TaxID=543526 RepID=D2S0H9_HALTV|nr:aldolase/citrate lyase family protein [Haloterrigena turkmenica]ADB62876.1 4-hydroxy-2-oxovalerate aldolase [Haloterrigena turkmenica DSM 5511]
MTFHSALRDREPLVGTWVALSDPAIAELSACLEFDAVMIDGEHSTNSIETITEMARAIDAADVDPDPGAIVRLSENDPTEIKRVLDAGVDGVMAPMIDTPEDARALVEATRYPPEGVRGVGYGRGTEYGEAFPEYLERANEDLVTIAQIETEAGLENVEEIAAVDGLDGLFVGPADLSAALGIFGETDGDEFVEAVDRVLEAGHAVNKPVATLAFEEDEIERWVDRGFDFVLAGVDIDYVKAGGLRAKAMFEDAMEKRDG